MKLSDPARAVSPAAGVDRAHVYGLSLGGMIAQEIALRHPDRIARLVLGATHPGGDRAIAADGRTVEFFHRRGGESADPNLLAPDIDAERFPGKRLLKNPLA